MSQIVKGLLFHYSTETLAGLLRARAGHHLSRATEKEKALPALREAVETVRATQEAKAVAQMSKTSNLYQFDAAGQVESLKNDIRDHKNKALVFEEMAKQLVPNATYELGETDLRRLEILK